MRTVRTNFLIDSRAKHLGTPMTEELPGRGRGVAASRKTGCPDISVDTATTDTRTYVYSDSAGTVHIFFIDDDFAEPVSARFSRKYVVWTPATNPD